MVVLVPAVVIFLIIKKAPAIPVLLTGSILGGVFAVLFQQDIIHELAMISDVEGGISFKSFVIVFALCMVKP